MEATLAACLGLVRALDEELAGASGGPAAPAARTPLACPGRRPVEQPSDAAWRERPPAAPPVQAPAPPAASARAARRAGRVAGRSRAEEEGASPLATVCSSRPAEPSSGVTVSAYPVLYQAEYIEQRSRLSVFFRAF